MIGEIGERIAQRGQLPVEDRQDARFGRMQHHVVDAVVAMDDGRGLSRRDVLRQPFDQLVHLRDLGGLGHLVLFRPAVDLAGDIVAFLAEAFEARLFPVDIVQSRKGGDFRVVNRSALLWRIVGQGRVPDDATLDHVHHIEHRAGNAVVLAETVRLRDREAERIQGRDDAILAIDGVRRGQELSGRLAAHDVFFRRCDQLVGRVGLAALELAHCQRARVAFDIRLQPRREFRFVEAVAFGDVLGAGKEVRRVRFGHVLPCCRRPV